jgi:hypothetical protein
MSYLRRSRIWNLPGSLECAASAVRLNTQCWVNGLAIQTSWVAAIYATCYLRRLLISYWGARRPGISTVLSRPAGVSVLGEWVGYRTSWVAAIYATVCYLRRFTYTHLVFGLPASLGCAVPSSRPLVSVLGEWVGYRTSWSGSYLRDDMLPSTVTYTHLVFGVAKQPRMYGLSRPR